MPDHYQHLPQIERIVARFLDCTLPCEEWTHVAHLTVGLWLTRDHAPAQALDHVRRGIRAYNVVCKVPTTPTRGYHETLTCFYMHVIGVFWSGLSRQERDDPLAATNALIRKFGHRELPLEYYTKALLMSEEARSRWVPPNLRPLEQLLIPSQKMGGPIHDG
jgi:hypothetical protein